MIDHVRLLLEGKNKKVVLFGTGSASHKVVALLKGIGYDIRFYVDNNETKWGQTIGGLPVENPEKLISLPCDEYMIFVCSSYYPEISRQLNGYGLLAEEHYVNGLAIYEEMAGRDSGEKERLLANSMLLGKLNAERVKGLKNVGALREAEFKVFSQSGEDGIIQYLLANTEIDDEVFVEFGVQDYTEANTRFLLQNDNWRGLVLDNDPSYVESIQNDAICWKHDLSVRCAHVTKDNINQLIGDAGITGDIGLLSVDIDGNDYWVWQAIEVISPRIVICEYNSVFGDTLPVTVPYNEQFNRTTAHYSNLYFGASLPALCLLAEAKGYDFVGSNSIGSNAFFIRKDVPHRLKALTAKEGYVCSKFRESRDERGKLSYLSGDARRKAIEHLDVVHVQSRQVAPLSHFIETSKP